MLTQTLECLKEVIESSDNLILMGDFNCKEVCWEQWYTDGREETWGSKLLNLAMEKTEAEVQKLGVCDLFLDTYTFQAREFYIRMGFKSKV